MTERLVVDVSAVIGQVLEEDVGAAYAQATLERIGVLGADVPGLFWLELRNVLLVNERRERITPEITAIYLSSLSTLDVRTEHTGNSDAVLDVARRHGLTVYDAAYLDLAVRTGSTLATLDRELIEAASQAGVSVFTPSQEV